MARPHDGAVPVYARAGWSRSGGGGYPIEGAAGVLARVRKFGHASLHRPAPGPRSVMGRAPALYPRPQAGAGHVSGSLEARSMVNARPVNPMTTSMTVQVLSASISVRPLSLATIQNPLSFIHEQTIDPHPTAAAR